MTKSKPIVNNALVKPCSIGLLRMTDNDVCAIKNRINLNTSIAKVSSCAVNAGNVKVSDVSFFCVWFLLVMGFKLTFFYS
jgi:hypothetical protein